MTDIENFYLTHSVDENFDEDYYQWQCPEVINFYEPFASEYGISKREKYYFHYMKYGKEIGMLVNNEPIKHSVSIIVAAKNRTKNLYTTIKSWHELELISEIVVVDYSSETPINCSEFAKVKLIRVDGEKYFNLGKAYNLAFDFASGNIIIKIDADYELIDGSWLDIFLRNPQSHNYFIVSDYLFSRYTSGFFVIHRSNYCYFREDLNGYGYDEIDLHDRIIKHNPKLQKIIWFDIDKFIYHIPHDNAERVVNYKQNNHMKSEENNRNMCNIHSPTIPVRSTYSKHVNRIIYDRLSNKLDAAFCINLDERKDRWDLLANNKILTRFSAINSKKNKTIHKDYGLSLNPCNISSAVYFAQSDGAVGAYMSHYLLWKKMVDEQIDKALILEDDIEENALNKIISSNLLTSDFDIINLSQRISYLNGEFFFDGAEAYILTLTGAKKLLTCTEFPILLSNVEPQVYNSLVGKDVADWHHYQSITCPVDKFISYCCNKNADSKIRLSWYLYPIVEMGPLSSISDINNSDSEFVWDMDYSRLLNIYHTYLNCKHDKN